MKYTYDKRFGISCTPDCAEEWMEYIFDVGCGYDGCNTVESLQSLVDELIEASQKARVCLREGKIFYDKNEDERNYLATRAEREKYMEE